MPLIRPAVIDAWAAWNQPFEGRVAWMYADIKGLVTTGMGDLIDPVPAALELPWRKPDDTPASRGEILYEWQTVKNALALAHEGAEAAERVTALRLPDTAIDALIAGRLARNAAILAAHPPLAAFATWGAWQQLGLLSMAWAMGPGFPRFYPRFTAAAAVADWTTCGAECAMSAPNNPALARRSAATRAAFLTAAEEPAAETLTAELTKVS